jgi:hypothetical protein
MVVFRLWCALGSYRVALANVLFGIVEVLVAVEPGEVTPEVSRIGDDSHDVGMVRAKLLNQEERASAVCSGVLLPGGLFLQAEAEPSRYCRIDGYLDNVVVEPPFQSGFTIWLQSVPTDTDCVASLPLAGYAFSYQSFASATAGGAALMLVVEWLSFLQLPIMDAARAMGASNRRSLLRAGLGFFIVRWMIHMQDNN